MKIPENETNKVRAHLRNSGIGIFPKEMMFPINIKPVNAVRKEAVNPAAVETYPYRS